MKFSELSTGVYFSLTPDDGKHYVKLTSPLITGHVWNAKTSDGQYFNFSSIQEVEILNNFKRSNINELL